MIEADNAIQCGFQDGLSAGFACRQRLLCPPACSDFVLQHLVGSFELCGAFDNRVLQALIQLADFILGALALADFLRQFPVRSLQ